MLRPLFTLIFLSSAIAFPLVSDAHQGASGIVKERMDRFSNAKDQLKQIKKALSADDFATVLNTASSLREWASVMPDYFPEGSGMAPSEASPRIWEEFESFKVAAKNHEEAAIMLMEAADANDKDTSISAFKALAGTCSSCHRQFRQFR